MKSPSILTPPVFCAMLCVVPLANADDTSWTAAGGGGFNVPGNWDNGVPGTDDRAIFDLDATFTVNFDDSFSSDLLLIGGPGLAVGERTHVTLDLSGPTDPFTYSLLNTGGTAVRVYGPGDVTDPDSPGASLTITGGTLAIAGGLRIAHNEGASSGQNRTGAVIVSGADARLEVGSFSSSRYANELGILTIEQGASALIGDFRPGIDGGGGANSVVNVRGAGSTMEVTGFFRQLDGALTMTIADGGQVTAGTADMAGRNNAATHMLISGADSLFDVGAFRPLSWGAINNRVATVVVAAGGEIRSGTVQDQFGGTNNRADYLVTGTGSEWNASAQFNLGGNASSAFDRPVQLIVADGGLVSTTVLRLYFGGILSGDATVETSNATGVDNRGGLVAPGFVDTTITHGISGISFTYDEAVGTLTVDGNYSQRVIDYGTTEDPDVRIGTLRIKVGQSSADQLVVTGGITLVDLDGIFPLLEIVAFDSPVLNPNDTFQILDWSTTLTGSFDIDAFDPGPGLSWDFSNLYVDGTISIIPEPSIAALMVGAVAGLLAFTRRRRQRKC